MAQAIGLYAIIAYTRAGEGYGLCLSLELHIRPWVYVTEHGSAHYHRKAERRKDSSNVALRSVDVAQSKL